MTLTLVGDLPRPTNTSEYAFITVEIIVGLIIFAIVLGEVSGRLTLFERMCLRVCLCVCVSLGARSDARVREKCSWRMLAKAHGYS